MWKCFIFFLVFFVPEASFGQQTQQLTNNSYFDGDPHIYECRIAWNSYYKDFPKVNAREIFLSENGIIKQLTYDGGINFEPRVGSHYVTWRRFMENTTATKPEKSEIWCYDGINNRKISLNSTENANLQTVGKYIVWTGDNDIGENKFYIFNGEKTEILPINKRTGTTHDANSIIISNEGIIVKEDIPTGGRRFLFYDFNNYHLIAENKNDTNVAGMWLSGRTVLFTKTFPGEPQFTLHYYMYKDSKITALPELDSIKRITHFDSTYIVWEDRKEDFTNYKLNVWKDGKIFFLSQFPFNSTQLHPDLSKLRFAWHERINKISNNFQILYFNGRTINTISNNSNLANYRPVISGNSVVWAGQKVSTSRYDDVTNTTEIFLYSIDEDCKSVSQLDENLQKVFYNTQNKSIQLEFFGTEVENYIFTLYDLQGRLILNKNITINFGLNSIPISTVDLQQSIYLLRLDNLTKPDKSITKKLLITR